MEQENQPKYELLKIEDGVEWRKYPNGNIRDQKGRLLVIPDEIKEKHWITSENHEKWVEARKQKYLEAIESGVTEGVKAYGVHDAVSKIMAKRAEVAATDGGRAGNEAAKIILQALDAFQDKKTTTEKVERQEYYIDPDTQAVLEELIKLRRRE